MSQNITIDFKKLAEEAIDKVLEEKGLKGVERQYLLNVTFKYPETLDEAISYFEPFTKIYYFLRSDEAREITTWNMRLVEWLKELKDRRDNDKELVN